MGWGKVLAGAQLGSSRAAVPGMGCCLSASWAPDAAAGWTTALCMHAVLPTSSPPLPTALPCAGCGTCGRTRPPTAAPRCLRATCTRLRRTCCAATGAQTEPRCGRGAGGQGGPGACGFQACLPVGSKQSARARQAPGQMVAFVYMLLVVRRVVPPRVATTVTMSHICALPPVAVPSLLSPCPHHRPSHPRCSAGGCRQRRPHGVHLERAHPQPHVQAAGPLGIRERVSRCSGCCVAAPACLARHDLQNARGHAGKLTNIAGPAFPSPPPHSSHLAANTPATHAACASVSPAAGLCSTPRSPSWAAPPPTKPSTWASWRSEGGRCGSTRALDRKRACAVLARHAAPAPLAPGLAVPHQLCKKVTRTRQHSLHRQEEQGD